MDNKECFKWFLIRYLNPADRNPAKIIRVDRELIKQLDFKRIKFPVEVKNCHKIEIKKNYYYY